MFVKAFRCLLVIVAVSLVTPGSVDACTIFNATEGDRTLVGNNEDYSWCDPYIHFVPATQDYYGRMVMINCGLQGGMNDQGLFFDVNALTTRSIAADPFKEVTADLISKILGACATVEEVLVMYDHYFQDFNSIQIQWVDATGASLVVGYGDTAYEYQPKTETFQVSTNFNLLTFLQYPDTRYTTAVTWLTNWRNISENLFSHILTLTSQTSSVYSNIYDLNTLDVYFHCHDQGSRDYLNAAKINLDDELAQGSHDTYLTDLTYSTRASIMPPGLVSLTPACGSLTAQPSANLVMKFNEVVYEGYGNVTIKEYLTDDTVEVIDIGDASGFGTQFITINPTQNLDNDTLYYVLVDDTCLVDAQSTAYHGIPIKKGWRFGTVE